VGKYQTPAPRLRMTMRRGVVGEGRWPWRLCFRPGCRTESHSERATAQLRNCNSNCANAICLLRNGDIRSQRHRGVLAVHTWCRQTASNGARSPISTTCPHHKSTGSPASAVGGEAEAVGGEAAGGGPAESEAAGGEAAEGGAAGGEVSAAECELRAASGALLLWFGASAQPPPLRPRSNPGARRGLLAKPKNRFIEANGFMAGLGNNPVQVLSTCRDLHWEFLRLRTGFELPSSWVNRPGYGSNRNRNSFCVMRWPHIDLGPQDLNGFQRPKSFPKSSWK
jgi:hypothetical protein